MASNIHIVCRTGAVLDEDALARLKASVKGEVVIKGEADEDVYRAAIDRWNKAGIDEAVMILP